MNGNSVWSYSFVDERCRKGMANMCQADGNASVAQIISLYDGDIPKYFTELTTRRAFSRWATAEDEPGQLTRL